MLNTSIRSRIVSLDEENPISLSTEEIQKEIQEAAVDYYAKHHKCKVHAYALHRMPTYGCTQDGEPIDKFQCVVVVNYGNRWEHAVDVDMVCTKSKKVEHKPDSTVPIPQLYDVWDTTTDFARQGKDATDPEKPIPRRPKSRRNGISFNDNCPNRSGFPPAGYSSYTRKKPTTKELIMAKKKIDLVAEIKKAEGKRMGTRILKLNQLVTAKEEHDKAVKKAHDDELKEFQGLLADFIKRVPYLSLLVDQLSKLTTLPTVPLTFPEKTYIFGAYPYIDLNNKTQWGIGAKKPAASVYNSPSYILLGVTGEWVTYNKHKDRNFSCDQLNDNYIVGVGSRYYPDSKEFMIAALEWEKTLLATVDSL